LVFWRRRGQGAWLIFDGAQDDDEEKIVAIPRVESRE
jgi:predicted NUDIX family NTP pyrophosphohydrolase